jgi:hypothetical protein
MTRTLFCTSILACVAACPGDTPATTDVPATDAGTDATGSTVDTSGSTTDATPTTGTTEPTSTTGEDPTTTAGTETGETTGGDSSGAARVVYMTRMTDEERGELYFVDCTGPTPGPAVRINHDLDPDWSVVGYRFSPSKRWLSYTPWHPRFHEQTWIVDLSGPEPGAPAQLVLPPNLSPSSIVPHFSHDETRVATIAGGSAAQLYLCSLGPAGECVMEAWGVPLVGAGKHDYQQLLFSPDDARLAYSGDPDDDGSENVYLAGTAPGDAGVAVELDDPMYPDDAEVTDLAFSPDGKFLYYRFHSTLADTSDARAVDISVDPPALPTAIPFGRYRSDMRGGADWKGMGDLGDLWFFPIDGTVAGEPVSVHDVPGRVSPDDWEWSSDGRWLLYLADAEGAPGEWELFAVDTDGPMPSTPIKIAGPVAAGGGFDNVGFGPDPTLVSYFLRGDGEAARDLYIMRLHPPGEPVMLSAPLPTNGDLPGLRDFSPSGARVLYSGAQESAAAIEMFMVETAAPGAPIKISAPLGEATKVAQWGDFSTDEQRAFYRAQHADQEGYYWHLHQVDLAAPGLAVQVTDPSHHVQISHVIPPASR